VSGDQLYHSRSVCNTLTLNTTAVDTHSVTGFAILHYILVYKREKWMIEYLDEDDNVCRYKEPCTSTPSINAMLSAFKHFCCVTRQQMPELWLPRVLVRYPDIDSVCGSIVASFWAQADLACLCWALPAATPFACNDLSISSASTPWYAPCLRLRLSDHVPVPLS